jgi:hypothetical protein
MAQRLDIDADQALFLGEVDGVVATFHENERPLHGLAGLLDWRFHGVISRQLEQGILEGKSGECAYLPVTRDGKTFHLILVGAGSSAKPGERAALSAAAMKSLQKNLASLKLGKLAISRKDFGSSTDVAAASKAKGVSLWIAP